ncbi:sigma-70 family RNA polymerase sigma factor [Aestuariimicrobium sp. p3-SID1156]|uniref:sigma-70 family RNA polymerase sigma factor n=1 Tax=Aestuariimicrobium sp. p3-SID1156 TaxID=2916038 RepID=UPI00223B3D6D|nr:sigma-70 family RNA polymerase sigma factor [Aestuariimicrobium sp. p3-SID1156]MCT1459258.1 sigma-70 family RNA polymerase sigma factor [Aestuariimicrobium sp. p3-SID1156]
MDDEAFVALAEELQPRLSRTAWGLSGEVELARDLVQETLVRAYQHRSRVGRARSPEAYVRTILLNLWRSQLRGRRELLTSQVHDAPHRDDLHLERAALLEALAGLSNQQRMIVVLRHIDDLPVKQVADLVGCSEQTVTTQDARALARLRLRTDLADLLEE